VKAHLSAGRGNGTARHPSCDPIPEPAAFRSAPFDYKIFSFQIPKLAHPLRKSAAEIVRTQLGCRGYGVEKTDAPERRLLLRARRERPRCRTAEQCDELAPVHSITSSARC
jgi:hypothetical protein